MFLCLWSVVVYPCMYRGRNSSGLRRKSAKPGSELITRLRFFSTESKRCTHLEETFFRTQFLVQNRKQCSLGYACGLNYFTHFDSSIIQNHIVDFVDHFRGSHFHWTSRTVFIICG
ncbi:hypothetical protein AVEN_221108-1 [Araneus ventricosus]|uniref:Uncharacterized protein n=1 Tax=Araneus ventricosus TaxID=182803 RepID=A0A4Y2T4S5_ARAVE|nr:hypothetical protein AVEN_221108-1 [Araneus ventricosus]